MKRLVNWLKSVLKREKELANKYFAKVTSQKSDE